jgi:hypothetical protein
MWAPIIKAIGNAIGQGAAAGIKVADSQHGGGVPISNMDAKQTDDNILSDETAKSAQNVSTDDEETDKDALAALKQYGIGVGKGFANAGAIATGKSSFDWKDIDTSAAKKAVEDTIKGWREKRQNKSTGEK